MKILESKMAKVYKEEDSTLQVEGIIKKISAHNQALKKLEQEMNHLINWDQNFSNFTKSFNLFEKKRHSMIQLSRLNPTLQKLFLNI